MPLPAPSVRLPSTTSNARRIASEAAQSTLLAARRFSPGPTPSPALTAAAWSLVLLWQPRIGSLVARAVRRHPILLPTAEDLRQQAQLWAHEIALTWDPDRGRSWPGYLKLCLSRRLSDHHRRTLIDRQRHTDRPLATNHTDADADSAHPEPVDPRPDPAQLLADRRRLAAIQADPAATLHQLLTDPAASLPQRGDRIEACGLQDALQRLLDVAPITSLQRTVLGCRMGTREPSVSVPDLAGTLGLTPARVKLLQRIAFSRIQQTLRDHPEIAHVDPRWPIEQVPLLTTARPPRQVTARAPRRTLTTIQPQRAPTAPAQLCLLDWMNPMAAVA